MLAVLMLKLVTNGHDRLVGMGASSADKAIREVRRVQQYQSNNQGSLDFV